MLTSFQHYCFLFPRWCGSTSLTLQLCSLRSAQTGKRLLEPSFDTESSFDLEVSLRAERTQCEAGPKGRTKCRVEDRVTLNALKGHRPELDEGNNTNGEQGLYQPQASGLQSPDVTEITRRHNTGEQVRSCNYRKLSKPHHPSQSYNCCCNLHEVAVQEVAVRSCKGS
jgi:hypothetical protein